MQVPLYLEPQSKENAKKPQVSRGWRLGEEIAILLNDSMIFPIAARPRG
jgi:hypothetical protein